MHNTWTYEIEKHQCSSKKQSHQCS